MIGTWKQIGTDRAPRRHANAQPSPLSVFPDSIYCPLEIEPSDNFKKSFLNFSQCSLFHRNLRIYTILQVQFVHYRLTYFLFFTIQSMYRLRLPCVLNTFIKKTIGLLFASISVYLKTDIQYMISPIYIFTALSLKSYHKGFFYLSNYLRFCMVINLCLIVECLQLLLFVKV